MIIAFLVAGTFFATSTAYAKTTPAKKATKWALTIAGNDSYTYGNVNTCPKCKPTVQKKYGCAGFVIAAYAHGANDKTMKKWCQDGLHRTTKSLYSAMKGDKNWKSMGRLSASKLKQGDVIFWKGHVEIYAGKNKTVGARGHNTISPKNDIAVYKLQTGWSKVMRHK